MVTDPPMLFKQAFVTGATGIVGIPLCLKLAEMGVEVTAYSRSQGDFGFTPNTKHVAGDIQDRDALASAMAGADVVFHVAAAVHGSASTYAEFERMNVAGTENVARAAIDAGARFVHVSSVNVEGFRRGMLTDAYAETKSIAEDFVLGAVRDGELDAVIVRPATVFGDELGRGGMIVDRLLSGSFRVLPAPSRMISPVWSGDLAVALINAANAGKTGETYTVAGPPMRTSEFVQAVCSGARVAYPRLSLPVWAISLILQLAWWSKSITRWTPPVSVEAVRSSSIHDGSEAADSLGFEYTPLATIFKR